MSRNVQLEMFATRRSFFAIFNAVPVKAGGHIMLKRNVLKDHQGKYEFK